MKKTYMKPEIDPVVMQHTNIICGSITKVSGNTDISFGGQDTSGEDGTGSGGFVKDHNVWDEEW